MTPGAAGTASYRTRGETVAQDETDAAARLAGVLLSKWKRESEEEMASLPGPVDPELISPVTDTSHGELAQEYAVALLPLVRELQADELEKLLPSLLRREASRFDAVRIFCRYFAGVVRDRAAALRGEAGR